MNIELKTAAAYIRVSTDNQTELSPDSQIKVIRQFAKQHGFIVPKEYIFRDDGISGRSAQKRPEFIRMIAAAKQKPSPFCAILLWKFSRFARNQEESIFYKSMLRKNKVDVLSVSEPVIDGPFGSLIERIIEWTDEYYSIRLSGEVKRGMTEKVERGGAVSIPAFGYDIVDKKYIINEEQAQIVRKIFSDFLNGKGAIQLARELNSLGIKTNRDGIWENRTVDYILRNPVYIGKIRWNPKRRTRRNYEDPDIMIKNGIHEPIVDPETFEKVQQIYAENARKHRPYSHSTINKDYMLHGLVKCSNCGASLSMIGGESLQCIGYSHGKCDVSHSVRLSIINETVLDGIEEALKTGRFDLIVKSEAISKPQIDVTALIERDLVKLKRIKEAYEDGVYTLEEYRESKTQIDEHIEFLKQEKKRENINKKDCKRDFIEKNKSVLETLRDAAVNEKVKNELLKSFVDHITFFRRTGETRIHFFV